MKILLMTLAAATCLVVGSVNAKPLDGSASNAAIEIVRQKLVKFPDDLDQAAGGGESPSNSQPGGGGEKSDEAQRILAEIAKINQALGYVKKQPDQPKLPPILDSSQYLFPQPSFHPFHAQHHQASGSNGETILIPSIRSFDFSPRHRQRSKPGAYNVPPTTTKRPVEAGPAALMSLSEYQTYLRGQEDTRAATTSKNHSRPPQFYYRPNAVSVPAPANGDEQSQLPAHFMIPVRLYKLNKEEYIEKYAPQEYRVKGYKIVGDIDHFYGKAKSKGSHSSTHSKSKTAPKYHLFFLPHEMVLNNESRVPQNSLVSGEDLKKTNSEPVRDEKLTNRPARPHENPLSGKPTSSSGSQHGGMASQHGGMTSQHGGMATQHGGMATQHGGMASQHGGMASQHNSGMATQQPGGGGKKRTTTRAPVKSVTTVTASTVEAHITAPPTRATAAPTHVASADKPAVPSTIRDHDPVDPHPIKTAFQNIFKFPFRPTPATDAVLQQQPNQYFGGAVAPQYASSSTPGYPQPGSDTDYRWDDESGGDYGDSSNSAMDSSGHEDEHEEKHIFAHHHQQQQQTQKEAIRHGGIIIQKLKVRKGGIAIAGPGGVATAGSGGTAIVGPGGYALTHPRSLTIAGPGAKVIAIPPEVDLRDALKRTNLEAKIFPREGKIVATGPTVYYAPALPDSGAVVL